MITKHSIDLTRISEPCFAYAHHIDDCKVLIKKHKGCNTYKCPFYKPANCKDWVRIEDRTRINLIPPEDAYGEER